MKTSPSFGLLVFLSARASGGSATIKAILLGSSRPFRARSAMKRADCASRAHLVVSMIIIRLDYILTSLSPQVENRKNIEYGDKHDPEIITR